MLSHTSNISDAQSTQLAGGYHIGQCTALGHLWDSFCFWHCCSCYLETAACQISSWGTSKTYQYSLVTFWIFLGWILPEIIEWLSRTWSILTKDIFIVIAFLLITHAFVFFSPKNLPPGGALNLLGKLCFNFNKSEEWIILIIHLYGII